MLLMIFRLVLYKKEEGINIIWEKYTYPLKLPPHYQYLPKLPIISMFPLNYQKCPIMTKIPLIKKIFKKKKKKNQGVAEPPPTPRGGWTTPPPRWFGVADPPRHLGRFSNDLFF
jgi:hypothetical protein